MPRFFVGNFDFEHRLADPERGVPAPSLAPSLALARRNAELAFAWLAIAEEEDFLWTPEACDLAFVGRLAELGLSAPRFVARPEQLLETAESIELVPWGWSADMAQLAAAHGFRANAPPIAAVRTANSRLFSLALETEWNVGLPEAAALHSIDELRVAIGRITGHEARWVVKAIFGMSGRQRLLGRGLALTDSVANWCAKTLAREGAILFEPWVEKIDEVGIQLDVPALGEPKIAGVVPLLTDATGAYRGSQIDAEGAAESDWSLACEFAMRAAGRVQQLGYFGPLGIDALRYRDTEGAVRLRPLMDINARFTMGRLALGWKRLLSKGEWATWLHLRVAQHPPALSGDCRLIVTSPTTIGTRPAEFATALVIRHQ
jgi:hypothetical protein